MHNQDTRRHMTRLSLSETNERQRCFTNDHKRSLPTTVGADVAQSAVAGRFEARSTFGAFAIIETISVCLTLERCNKLSVCVQFT